MSEPRKILVVANETLTGDELLDACAKVGDSDAIVVVIAPVNAPREGYVVYDNTRRAAAGRRLDRTLTSPRGRDRGRPGTWSTTIRSTRSRTRSRSRSRTS